MTIKIYRPTDSLQVFVHHSTNANPKLYTATHLRIYTGEQDNLKIKDELLNYNAVENVNISILQDEAGSPLGGDIDAVLLALSKIIG